MRQFCHPHVDNVLLFEVDLRRAARPFQYDNIVFFFQRMVGIQDGPNQLPFVLVIGRCIHIANGYAVDNHLGARIIRGLE